MTSKNIVSFIIAFTFLLVISGCGPSGPPVQFVEGTVSVDGELLEGVTVTFCPTSTDGNPDDLTRPLMASGTTDEKGHFRLSAVQGGAIGGGTTMGEYAVAIVKKINTRPPPVVRQGDPPPTPAMTRPIFHYYTPEIYERQETTPITVEVNRGRNRFDIDLKSDGTGYTINGENFTVDRR